MAAPTHFSRYARVATRALPTSAVEHDIARSLRASSLSAENVPARTTVFVAPAGTTFASLANAHLGDPRWWWILADMNPSTFYPWELEDGQNVRVPPLSSLTSFRRGFR